VTEIYLTKSSRPRRLFSNSKNIMKTHIGTLNILAILLINSGMAHAQQQTGAAPATDPAAAPLSKTVGTDIVKTIRNSDQSSSLRVPPDMTIAADGSGDFKTIQAALDSVPRDNRQRLILFIKDGVYGEKIRIDAAFITLRGQSRAGTRIEFPQGAAEFRAQPDKLGIAVVNIDGNDCVLENLTVQNTHGVIGVHAFAVYGRGDRNIIQDCDVLSQGNDTLSMWRAGSGQFARDAAPGTSPDGRYYHARLKVCGSVDFVCPRGWCYMTDSTITEVNPQATAAIWHDGSRDQDMKFVLRNCQFDGPENWYLARHHHDAQFFLLDCTFSKKMRDQPPYRVHYPLNGGTPTEADIKREKELDPSNIWGERAYYCNCHRDGGDYAWHKDNLAAAPGAPKPEQITAAWTFAGKWDPERTAGPVVQKIAWNGDRIEAGFSENVTVKGRPRLALRSGGFAEYASGSGSDTLVFTAPAGGRDEIVKLDLQGGFIIATEAAATLRVADAKLP
jgi:pectinesterase